MIRFVVGSALAVTFALPLAAQAPQAAPAGEVIGVGNFAHIVADLDTALRFYRDVIGLEVTVTQPFAPNAAIAKLGATEGGQSRIAVLDIPGSELGVELIEYKDIERSIQRPRFFDPGAANLQLRMRDIDAVFEKLMAFPGAKVITGGGKPVTIEVPNGEIHAVFVQDPDGFVIELVEVPAPPAGSPEGNVLGAGFEPAIANSEESVKFYNELLGFDFELGAGFNDNQVMAATAGAPGASFRQPQPHSRHGGDHDVHRVQERRRQDVDRPHAGSGDDGSATLCPRRRCADGKTRGRGRADRDDRRRAGRGRAGSRHRDRSRSQQRAARARSVFAQVSKASQICDASWVPGCGRRGLADSIASSALMDQRLAADGT